jgi:nucleoid-associated protein YgaU
MLTLALALLTPLFAQTAAPAPDGEDIPNAIRNNRYYLESLRYTNLARLAMLEGDYDAVEENSREAIKWAEDSDAYVRAFLENRKPALPAQYTVRTWKGERDCLWIIAGQAWVYNDPYKWRLLYNANKDKLPDPQNPNWLEPGIVLDIPSIKGETRRGIWAENKQYPSFN